MAVRVVFCLLSWFVLTAQTEEQCEIANVQVENEDGTTQVFEVKKLEPVKGESCVLCALKPINSVPRLTALRSNVFVAVGEAASDCDVSDSGLPLGLCASTKDTAQCSKESACNQDPEELAEGILERKLLPLATGDHNVDKILATGIVMMNFGDVDDAINEFLSILQVNPNNMAAYYFRGIAYSRKGLEKMDNAMHAIQDFTEAIQRSSKTAEPYARRAEVHVAIRNYENALEDLKKAAQYSPDRKINYLKGIVNLLLENFADAEVDFKKNLESEGYLYISSYFHLGLAQYYRGKIRNAIEVFKEVLKIKPDHIDASSSLAQAFKELGNLRASKARFNQSQIINPKHLETIQLKGNMLYYSGEPVKALHEFKKCLEIDPRNINCQYMQALTKAAIGKFYDSVKSSTKVMVRNTPAIRASSEFLKAHYLREYVRYIHAHLDDSLLELDADEELEDEFKDHWAKLLPFQFRNAYKEQPGLQPHIKDVATLEMSHFTKNVQNLICKANKIGWFTQVSTDGYTPNKRLNLAMGLASIHISQILETRWKGLRQNKQMDRSMTWKEIFNIAIQYRRLVDPEQAVLWLDDMPDHINPDGYRTNINFIKGSVSNLQVSQYFDLVFKLVKTMLEHYSGEGAMKYPGLREDVEKAKSCEDLLSIARRRQINQHGFIVSTQVPSSRRNSAGQEADRLDGSMLVLTENVQSKIQFSVNIANTHSRTQAYHAELDAVFNQLQEEIKRTGISKITDVDSVLNIILTLVYYFYNLMPLSRGSSVVSYSVALGVIMSIGRQVNGKIPNGKLLEMEAMLSGAPDAFILVTKQWMNIKRLNVPTSSLPKVWEEFPTVRSVIEVLNVNTDSCL